MSAAQAVLVRLASRCKQPHTHPGCYETDLADSMLLRMDELKGQGRAGMCTVRCSLSTCVYLCNVCS